ncbi:g7928 [Coccomyxa elongata]
MHADYTDANIGKPDLTVKFVASDKAGVTSEVDTGNFAAQEWILPTKVNIFNRTGVILTGEASLSDDFGNPGALIVTKKPADSKINRVFLDQVRAWPKGADPSTGIQFLANSWVHDQAPNRIFFTGAPLLPSQTPPGLQALRKQELQNLRGPPGDNTERKVPDRIYAYDVYNDLGGKDAATNAANRRPILGQGRGGTLPYPRRLRTNRPLDQYNDEPLPASGKAWLPLDEMFFASKEDEFTGGTVYSVGSAASSAISQLFDAKPEVTKFADFSAVDRLYARELAKEAVTNNTNNSPFNFAPDKLRETYENFPQKLRNDIEAKLVASNEPDSLVQKIKKFFGIDNDLDQKIFQFMEGLVATWPPTLVRNQREFTWTSDEEVGRQTVAGCNPCTIRMVDEAFLKVTKITASDLKGLLNGLTLEEAAAEQCLFWQDYHTVLVDQIAPRVKDYPGTGHQYAGRGLFFKNKDTGAMPIVAIELQEPGTSDVRVFTPTNVRLEVWQLAKAVYSTLDSAVHQLVSHFGETHAVMEPFAIATRRQLSALHPVYQLMQPHFRYTFNINANARGTLINAGGVVEKVFTPGPLSMEFSARVYGETWTFKEQGLPEDLISRGIAKRNGSQLTLLLEDYPFAEDGLLVWNAFEEYFTEYLNLYYSDNGADGKPKVTDDEELLAWYKEAKEEGHPDKKDGWIPLTDIASLVQILATIAWIGSAHHAAVNFGQYSYSGYMPNKASFVAHAIPVPDSDEEKALLNDFEFEFLRTLSDPIRAVQTMLLTKLLSNHAQDEEYLAGPQNDWISDPKAVAVKAKFEEALAAAELEMIKRNEDARSRARHSPSGVPYQLMYPSTKTEPVSGENRGMTGRGIPYSVSI